MSSWEVLLHDVFIRIVIYLTSEMFVILTSLAVCCLTNLMMDIRPGVQAMLSCCMLASIVSLIVLSVSFVLYCMVT